MKLKRAPKIAGLIAVFLLNLFPECYAQQPPDPVSPPDRKLASIADTTVLSFVHIRIPPNAGRNWYNPKSFKLFYKTDKTTWTSDKLIPLTIDSSGYLVKVRIPIEIYKTNPMFTCVASVGNGNWRENSRDTISYGGVTVQGIQLQLKSNPVKAEVYLVPRRIWLSQLKDTNWKNDNTIIEDWIVDSDKTNTSVNIDETVYMVIFKLGNRYMVRTHRTKAREIEPVQKVSVDF